MGNNLDICKNVNPKVALTEEYVYSQPLTKYSCGPM